jgi:hypothetical protein
VHRGPGEDRAFRELECRVADVRTGRSGRQRGVCRAGREGEFHWGDLGTPTNVQVEAAMKGHVLAQTELMGTYQKHAQ